MKIILLSATIVTSMLFHACNKSHKVYPVNANLKAAFNFQQGSYWIYKDSLSSRIDSFFVTSNNHKNYPGSVGNSYTEDIQINISEYNIYPLPITDTQTWMFEYISNSFNAYFYTKNIYSGYISYTPIVNYPYTDTLSSPASYYPDTATLDNIYNAYALNGQSFTNVAKVNHKADWTFDVNFPLYSFNDYFYIAPNVGLIKIVQNHPQDSVYHVWELQRWHVVL